MLTGSCPHPRHAAQTRIRRDLVESYHRRLELFPPQRCSSTQALSCPPYFGQAWTTPRLGCQAYLDGAFRQEMRSRRQKERLDLLVRGGAISVPCSRHCATDGFDWRRLRWACNALFASIAHLAYDAVCYAPPSPSTIHLSTTTASGCRVRPPAHRRESPKFL